jgi:hypothetical protein
VLRRFSEKRRWRAKPPSTNQRCHNDVNTVAASSASTTPTSLGVTSALGGWLHKTFSCETVLHNPGKTLAHSIRCKILDVLLCVLAALGVAHEVCSAEHNRHDHHQQVLYSTVHQTRPSLKKTTSLVADAQANKSRSLQTQGQSCSGAHRKRTSILPGAQGRAKFQAAAPPLTYSLKSLFIFYEND